MANTIRVAEFDANFIFNHQDGRSEFHPCRVVGVKATTSGPLFIAMVEYDDGRLQAQEFFTLYRDGAQMPAW